MRPLGLGLLAVALIGVTSSTVFLGIALAGRRRFRKQASRQEDAESEVREFPPVSILKPLHGAEPRLRENLESFFVQDYPAYEVLFAVDHEDDGALPIARRVCEEHPSIPSRILITGEPPWPNPPAYSFARMAAVAHHDFLITSDSDVFVAPDYLKSVTAPLLEENTGMVTCLYRGYNGGGFWSLMDAVGMSVEMTAGVLSANLLEGMKFGLGPTIAVRRDALQAMGGYESLGDYFSNDFVIGNRIAERGYTVVLSRHVIDHVVPPMTFGTMWRRQVRWATGTKHSRPRGHFGTVFTYAAPYGLIGLAGALLVGRPWLGVGLFAWTMGNRVVEALAIGWGIARDAECRTRPWLYPARDLLGFCVWVASYLSRNMSWRDGRFELIEGGRIQERDRHGNVVRLTRP